MAVYFNGLILGLSLIIALGPQNIFLLRQGAKRNHAVLSAIICLLCDITLVTASITGLHHIIEHCPAIAYWMTWFGAGFLVWYGLSAIKSAFLHRSEHSEKSDKHHTRLQIMLFALGFSLLNPQAIIDTLFIVGSGSNQFPRHETAFLSGIITSSLLWFSAITFTTHFFYDVLSKRSVWKRIEIISGILMIFLGIKLGLSSI